MALIKLARNLNLGYRGRLRRDMESSAPCQVEDSEAAYRRKPRCSRACRHLDFGKQWRRSMGWGARGRALDSFSLGPHVVVYHVIQRRGQ